MSVKEIEWKITPTSSPQYVKKCNKCGKQKNFYCSNKFRVNAQQKLVDVWLVYKCVDCDSTWNITIHSRVAPKTIPADIYAKFMANDVELANDYCFDIECARRNSAVVDYNTVEYEVEGETLTIDSMLQAPFEKIKINLKSKYFFELKFLSVLKQQIPDLSRSKMDRLIMGDALSFEPDNFKVKGKIKRDMSVSIDIEKLKQIFKE